MANFQVAINWNNVGGLADLNPQPQWKPDNWTKVTTGMSGVVSLQGRYYRVMYTPGLDEALWFGILSQCGLSIDTPTPNAKVTIGVPQRQAGGVNHYNAMAKYDQDGKPKFGLFWAADVLFVIPVLI